MKKLLPLLLLLLLTLTACTDSAEKTPTPQASQAPTDAFIPGDADAKTYILRSGLLKSITSVEKVPTRFVDSGPGYKLVIGRDFTDHDRAVWLGEDDAQKIHVINTTLFSAGLSKVNIIERLRDQGIVDRIFLAPVDLMPYDPTQQIAWYVSLRGKPDLYLWIDFKTGETLLQEQRNQ